MREWHDIQIQDETVDAKQNKETSKNFCYGEK